MEHIDLAPLDRSLAPLCRRYLLVLFETLPVRVNEQGVALSDWALVWALGALADGQYEMTGAWVGRRLREPAWSDVLDGLQVRGVEHIRFVVSANAGELNSALEGRYPNALVVATGSAPCACDALPRRHRSALVASREAMRHLQYHASRSIVRHGPFSSPRHASAFVIDRLERALQRVAVPGVGAEPGSGRVLSTRRPDKSSGSDASPI